MTQARITVRDEALSRAEQILKITKLGSLTELFNVLVTRYGNHLEATWIIPANSCLCSATGAPQTTTLLLDAIPNANKAEEIKEIDFDSELTGV